MCIFVEDFHNIVIPGVIYVLSFWGAPASMGDEIPVAGQLNKRWVI